MRPHILVVSGTRDETLEYALGSSCRRLFWGATPACLGAFAVAAFYF